MANRKQAVVLLILIVMLFSAVSSVAAQTNEPATSGNAYFVPSSIASGGSTTLNIDNLKVVAFGVGVKKLLLEIDHPALPDKYRWLICGALLLYLLFIAVMESDTVREGDDFSATLRAVLGYGSAVLVLVVALLGSGWNFTLLIAVLAAVFALQIVVHIVLDRSQAAGDSSHAQLP